MVVVDHIHIQGAVASQVQVRSAVTVTHAAIPLGVGGRAHERGLGTNADTLTTDSRETPLDRGRAFFALARSPPGEADLISSGPTHLPAPVASKQASYLS